MIKKIVNYLLPNEFSVTETNIVLVSDNSNHINEWTSLLTRQNVKIHHSTTVEYVISMVGTYDIMVLDVSVVGSQTLLNFWISAKSGASCIVLVDNLELKLLNKYYTEGVFIILPQPISTEALNRVVGHYVVNNIQQLKLKFYRTSLRNTRKTFLYAIVLLLIAYIRINYADLYSLLGAIL